MSKVADESVMRDMRLLKRNAYKAVDEDLIKSKSDGVFSKKEMEEVRDEIEPLISKFDDCVSKHIKMLKEEEGDQDEEIESREMYMELLHYKWQLSSKIMSERKLTLDGVSEAAVVVVDGRENGSMAEEGRGTPGIGS